MFCYSFDMSALVKRYALEAGSMFVRSLLTAPQRDVHITSELTIVEMISALKRLERSHRFISADARPALQLFTTHPGSEYWAEPIGRSVIDQATKLVDVHTHRALDALLLATALSVNRSLLVEEAPHLLFLSAEPRLVRAASPEGLGVENPNGHASPGNRGESEEGTA